MPLPSASVVSHEKPAIIPAVFPFQVRCFSPNTFKIFALVFKEFMMYLGVDFFGLILEFSQLLEYVGLYLLPNLQSLQP